MKKKKILSVLLIMMLMATTGSITAFAEETIVTQVFDDGQMTTVDLSTGAIVISEEGITVTPAGQSSGTTTALDPDGYRITGTNGNRVHNIKITTDTTIELDNVTLNSAGYYSGNNAYNTYGILITNGANGTIYVKGTNKIYGGGRFAGITVADDSSVTIKCPTHSDLPDGDPLKGKCRDADAACDPSGSSNPACTNTLLARGSQEVNGPVTGMSANSYALGAPGIGGVSAYTGNTGLADMTGFTNSGSSGGTINIQGSVITAESAKGDMYSGACIGSGYLSDKTGIINITGGLIRAYGSSNASGIGGGASSDNGTVTIRGNAYVDAYGGTGGAGIGGGGVGSSWSSSGVPSPTKVGKGGTVNILENAIVETSGGGNLYSSYGAGAGIGMGGAALNNVGFDYGSKVSIDSTAQVYAWSTGTMPAISTTDGLNHSTNPAYVLNHRVLEDISTSIRPVVDFYHQSNNDGSPDFSLSSETPYVSNIIPYRGGRNYAYTMKTTDSYAIKVATTGTNFKAMGHKEDTANGYFTPSIGLAHQDIVYMTSSVAVADVTVNYGESGTLTATPSLTDADTNPIVSYTWEKGVISGGTTTYTELSSETQQSLVYTPEDVYQNNREIVFRCKVRLQDGTIITSNDAKIKARGIDLTIKPKDITLHEGDTFPNLSDLEVEYNGFINGDTAANTDYISNQNPFTLSKINTFSMEIQKDDGTPITTTEGLESGEYKIIIKLDQNSDEELCRDNGKYYITTEVGTFTYVKATEEDKDNVKPPSTSKTTKKPITTEDGFNLVIWIILGGATLLIGAVLLVTTMRKKKDK